MSAATVAARVSADPDVQSQIVEVLEANGLTDAESERVLRGIDLYLNVAAREGLVVDAAMILRAASFALDRVWEVRRPVKEVAG